jgi:negative regulator of flagellin synthesis FlgM
MTTKIDSLGTVAVSLGSTGKATGERSAATGVASTAPAAPADKVSLTGEAVRMQQLDQAVNDGPQVDSKRVAAVKSALANGSYQVNAQTVAAKLSRFEWDMQP